VSRRVNLPAADDLFRPTVRAVPDTPEETETAAPAKPAAKAEKEKSGLREPSGRIRHDEKMTVYVTSDELLHIEQARLALRGELGLAVDRGRLVREALALVLTDFEEHGGDSALVRRLTAE
jgi:hypothetical protein